MLCIWSPFFPAHCPLLPRVPLALRCLIHWSRPGHNLKLQENPKSVKCQAVWNPPTTILDPQSSQLLYGIKQTSQILSCENLTLKKSDKHERRWINNIYICVYVHMLYEQIHTKVINKSSTTHQVTFPLSSAAVADPTACCGGGEGCLKSATHHAWDSDFESNQSLIYCDWLVFSRWCCNA